MEERDKFDIIQKLDSLKDDIGEMADIVRLIRREQEARKWFKIWLHVIYISAIALFMLIMHVEHINLYVLESDFLDSLSSNQNVSQHDVSRNESGLYD